MGNTPKKVIRNAPWSKLTYEINGLAMEVHDNWGQATESGTITERWPPS